MFPPFHSSYSTAAPVLRWVCWNPQFWLIHLLLRKEWQIPYFSNVSAVFVTVSVLEYERCYLLSWVVVSTFEPTLGSFIKSPRQIDSFSFLTIESASELMLRSYDLFDIRHYYCNTRVSKLGQNYYCQGVSSNFIFPMSVYLAHPSATELHAGF